MSLRVLLADDHPLFLDGVAALLQSHNYAVVGMAGDGQQALELARQTHPDLILMDINMPHMDGLAATRELTKELPATPVIILTVSNDDAKLFEAIKAGAKGYLLKNTGTQVFFSYLEGIAHGEAPIEPALAGKILKEFEAAPVEAHPLVPSTEPLSEREVEVLRLVTQGFTNREIGQRLGVSENTIKFHLKNILQKLHLRNRAQAVAYAMQTGLAGSPTNLTQ